MNSLPVIIVFVVCQIRISYGYCLKSCRCLGWFTVRAPLHASSISFISPSSAIPFSSCLQFFPASGSFPMSHFFTSGDQSIGVSTSASVLPVNTQDWSPLGWAGWITLQSKGLKSLLQHHSSKASILHHSAFFIVQTLTSIHDYWKNHSLD